MQYTPTLETKLRCGLLVVHLLSAEYESLLWRRNALLLFDTLLDSGYLRESTPAPLS